jgi:hypothetical protein
MRKPNKRTVTEEEFQKYKAKMLLPFFEKHGITVKGDDYDLAFIELKERSPEMFEHGNQGNNHRWDNKT